MRIKDIQAKVLLAHVKQPDTWFGLKYNMNLYRGCAHRCIYCDSRSECYGIAHFDSEILLKANAPILLREELARKRVRGVIGLGAMNDPFMDLPAVLDLTGQALAIIAEFGFPVHIITKSDRVVQALPTLQRIQRTYASVTFTLTTVDDDLAAQVEPFAPRPTARLAAMATLAEHGIQTGVTMMPILPFIEDTPENIRAIVEQAATHGARYIIPSFGMSLRDRQRAYYYRQLDRLFPGLRQTYERTYGNRYSCTVPHAAHLRTVFERHCRRYNIAMQLPIYAPQSARQLGLLDRRA